MIKERTKFYSSLDKKKYMDSMFHEFLGIQVKETMPVTRTNVLLLGKIHDYFEETEKFQKITKVIFVFLKETDSFSNFYQKLGNIKISCMKQRNMMCLCKKILKSIPVEKKYVEPIEYTIAGLSKRLDYLLKVVVPAYIEMTPLSNYVKEMGEEKFYEEICEMFPVGEDMEDDKLNEYIQKIFSSYSDDGNWEKGFNEYQEFLKEKYRNIEISKEQEAREKRKKLAEEAEKKLIMTSNNFQKLYLDGCITYGYNYSVSKLGSRVVELKKAGRERNKIVFLAKTKKGANAAPFYFSLETEDNLTKSVEKLTILEEFEKLPENIQEKIDNYELAAVEMMV